MANLPADVAAAMPFDRRDVMVDGVRISVVDHGPRDGPIVVLLHGNPTWSFLYRHMIGPLADAGLRVIVPDHAGFGMSDKPRNRDYYTIARHVDNLDAVLKDLAAPVSFVLQDWGGPIGMSWATSHPERVQQIIIANTVAFAPRRARPLSTFHLILGSPVGYHASVALDLVRRAGMRLGVQKKLDRVARRGYAWPMKDRGGRIAAATMIQRVPNGPDHPEAATLRAIEDGAPGLSNVPMTVLWADRDPVFPPKFAERWSRGYPHARILHVSKAGHFWQEDDPETFLRHILATLAPAATV